MMTYLKCTIFTLIALVVSLQSEAQAEVIILGTGQTKTTIKLSIVGHTGQDPVYRSLGSKTEFRIPNLKSQLVSKVMDDSHSYIDNASNSMNWELDYIPSSPTGNYWSEIEEFIPIDDVQNDSYSVHNSSAIPAPPAFMLLLVVAATRRRRNT